MNTTITNAPVLPVEARRLLRIALVNDAPEMRESILAALHALGHTVVWAENARALATLMCSHRFDVVVTDVLLHDGDGFDVIAHVKRAQPAARIVATSASGVMFSAKDYLHIARQLGAHETVEKPFGPETLVAAVIRAASR